MVQGLLDTPEVANPQLAAAQTLQDMQMQRALQHGFISQPPLGAPQQQSYLTPQNINEIYGILSANASDPTAVGQGYVGAMQRQQQIDTSNSPMERWLRLYGNINPYDFTEDSLADFHDTMVKTGDMAQAFRKLKRVETLTTKEQGFLNDAIKKAQNAEVSMGRMLNLASRYSDMAPQMRAGLIGKLNEWMESIIGSEGDVQALRTEYEQLKNRLVVEGLPPGVASDTDIAIAMRGWPSSTANPSYVAAFLRGAAKMEALKYAQAQHEASFLSRERTQQGQLEAWNRVRDVRALDALQRFGGVTAPTRPDGTPMTPEEAAAYLYGGSPSVSGAIPGAAPAAGGPPLSTKELLKKYPPQSQ